MNMLGRFTRLLILITVISLVTPEQSHAYLDPGTGSYVLQIVIGVLLGAAFAVKAFWFRIKTFFGSLISRKTKGQ